MNTFSEFLNWERASRDTIDVKRVYIDMAGDLVAGIMLSEIVYWHLPSRDGANDKLTVERDGHRWLAVRHEDWWDRVRISPKQAERAISLLARRGLIEKALYKFDGAPTVHLRIVETEFLSALSKCINEPIQNPYRVGNGFRQKGEMDFDERGKSISTKGGKPITKTTAKTTAKIKNRKAGALQEKPLQGANSLLSSSSLDDPILKPESPAISNEIPELTQAHALPQEQEINTMGSGGTAAEGGAMRVAAVRGEVETEGAVVERRSGAGAGKGARSALKARVLALFGYDAQRMTRQEHSRVGAVVKALDEAGYGVDDVEVIYAYCKARYVDFSPHALATNASAAVRGRRRAADDGAAAIDADDGAPSADECVGGDADVIAAYRRWLES